MMYNSCIMGVRETHVTHKNQNSYNISLERGRTISLAWPRREYSIVFMVKKVIATKESDAPTYIWAVERNKTERGIHNQNHSGLTCLVISGKIQN